MTTLATAHTARKPFTCGGYLCHTVIQPGDEYARHVAFPGDDVNSDTRPWVLRVCVACHTAYGQPMPPRRRRRCPDGTS